MTTAYVFNASASGRGHSIDAVADCGANIGFEGQPAGVAVFLNLDMVSSRADLLAKLADMKATILADKPLG